MSYQHRELNLTYNPRKKWSHFVLYTEPDRGIAVSGANAAVSIEERGSKYVQEWRGRLQRCEPNPLHTVLVPNSKIPELFHPCVKEDKDSPSAVGGSGCVCYQTFMDPEFGLPVVADHYRTVGGDIETWTYLTYAPLELRPDDAFHSLVIDGGTFWARTTDGVLVPLPQEEGLGYGVGYGGSGPTELTRYLQKLLDSEGRDTAANASSYAGREDRNLFAWVSSDAAERTQELTLQDLQNIRRQ